MSAYQKPVENLSVFNSAVFDEANTESLSLSKAQSLFLGRTGNPTSIATSTAFTNNISVNGLKVGLTNASNSVFSSGQPGSYTGIDNVFFGNNVAPSITTGAANILIGKNVALVLDSGYQNIGIGNDALNQLTTQSQNTAVGFGSFSTGEYTASSSFGSYSVISGTSAVAIGSRASAGGGGTALGYNALAGTNATAIGSNSIATANQISLGTSSEIVLCKGTTANGSLVADADIFVKGTIRAGMGVNGTLTTPATSKQTAFGVGALGVHTCNTAGATAFGFNALKACATSFGASLANTAFGANTLASIENQGYSCAFGVNSLITATGAANTAFGANSGYAMVGGTNNVFIGADNEANNHTNKISTGSRNVFVGNVPTVATGLSGTNNSTILGHNCTITGNNAVAIGYQASAGANQISLGTATETVLCKGTAANTSLVATSNITVNGCSVGQQPTINAGTGNTVLGVGVGAVMTESAINNTLVGNNAGNGITSSTNNTFIGKSAGELVTTSSGNVAVGCNALSKMTTGNAGVGNCVAIGEDAGRDIATVANSVFVGHRAGQLSVSSNNVFIGANAGVSSNGSGASQNVYIGSGAGVNSNQSGFGNTFVGYGVICSGTSNTNSTALGNVSSVAGFSNSTAIGNGATCTANNQIMLGRSTESVVIPGTGTSLTASGAISAVGVITTTSVLGMNSRIYNLDEYDGTASTPYAGALYQQGQFQFLRAWNNKAGGGTAFATFLYIQTAKADKSPVDSMVISSTDIQMKLPITLQPTYSAVAGAGQLGQVVSSTSTSFSVTTAAAVSFASFSNLPPGVWAFSYTIDLTTAGGTLTATIQSLYMTLTNGGAYSTKVSYGGSTRTHNTVVYAIGDNPCFSSALTYSNISVASYYPTFLISFTGAGATITANGYATATRIG